MSAVKKCPICQSKQFRTQLNCTDSTVSYEKFPISKCEKCGFLFTNNIPKKENLGKYYQSEEYISHSNSSKGLFNKLYKIVRSITLKNKVRLLGKETGTVLELGSGTGELLAACHTKGWTCLGVEPEEKARKKAKKNHKIELFETSEKIKLSENSTDRIMLWHVLEHIPNLQETIGNLKCWLKKEGEILIAVPNYKSWDAKYYQESWAAYDVPRHLYHFDKNSISKLLSQHNLEITKIKPMWFDAFYVSMLSEKIKSGHKRLLKGAIIGLLSNLRAFFGNQEFSSQIFIIRHKKTK
tara:strand:+ start:1113 stop:2000 length:888 start_codon:yes stop_codon:yes gene_type:complete